MRRVILLVLTFAAWSADQAYDIAVGKEEAFLVFGEGVSIHAEIGSVEIVDDSELGMGLHSVRLACSSSPNGHCTGTIGPNE